MSKFKWEECDGYFEMKVGVRPGQPPIFLARAVLTTNEGSCTGIGYMAVVRDAQTGHMLASKNGGLEPWWLEEAQRVAIQLTKHVMADIAMQIDEANAS